MITPTPRILGYIAAVVIMGLMAGCGGNETAQHKDKVEIRAAPNLTNDATSYANEAWRLINTIDPIVYAKQLDQIDEKVRKPLRQLGTDWRINVKMTDSVTEGKYALCRKALTSLDSWAREVQQNTSTVVQRQADYERDKMQCKDAIDNPALGNTDPKR